MSATPTQTVASTSTPSVPPQVEAAQVSADAAFHTALLSAGVAVAVAVLGQTVSGLVQSRTMRKSHENALALFQEQTAQTERVRHEDARREQAQREETQRREDRDRHLNERRRAYAEFAALARITAAAHRQWRDSLQEVERGVSLAAGPSEDELAARMHQFTSDQQHLDKVLMDFGHAYETIAMLAPEHVLNAATSWFGPISRGEPYTDVLDKRNAFTLAARADLGSDRDAP